MTGNSKLLLQRLPPRPKTTQILADRVLWKKDKTCFTIIHEQQKTHNTDVKGKHLRFLCKHPLTDGLPPHIHFVFVLDFESKGFCIAISSLFNIYYLMILGTAKVCKNATPQGKES